MKMTNSLFGRFLTIFSSNAIGFLTGLLATPIIVRTLGPSKYGVYAVLLSALGVLGLLADGGIFDGIRKFMAEANRSQVWQEQILAFYLRVSLLLVAIVGIA